MERPTDGLGRAGATARLVRVSVVLDGRLEMPALADVARLAGRLGFDAWWREPPLAGPAAGDARAGVAALLGTFGEAAGLPRVGMILDLDSAEQRWAATTWVAGTAQAEALAALADRSRLVLVGQPARVADALRRLPRPSRPRVAVGYQPGQRGAGGTAGGTSPHAVFVPVSAARDLDGQVAAAVAACGGGRVLVELPVSIGRTAAEAHARAAAETLFEITGSPVGQGLFGTLEQCQYRAAELVHAGATDLMCHIPNSRDVADVLAQLRAVATVSRDVLRPGEPRSPAPPPPVGWGGRSASRAHPPPAT